MELIKRNTINNMKNRKDIKRMSIAMQKVKNPREWTSPTPTPPSDPYGIKKWKATPQSERDKNSIKNMMDKTNKYDPSGMQQMYKNTGRISMVGHPGEYLIGGGAVGGFKTAKTLLGKAFEKGSKYVVKSAKQSAKPSSIGSNSL